MSETATKSAEMVSGPYYGERSPERGDLRENARGVPFSLTLRALRAGSDEPLTGYVVDIWHCDATGHYSGYDFDPDQQPQDVSAQPPGNPERWLRGAQTVAGDGSVRFETVFPGWYASRAPHIHLKVWRDDVCVLTTQLFFDEATLREVYARPEYARRVDQDTFNKTDTVLALTPESIGACWVDVEADGDGYRGTATLGVDPDAVSVHRDPPPGWLPPLGGMPHEHPVR